MRAIRRGTISKTALSSTGRTEGTVELLVFHRELSLISLCCPFCCRVELLGQAMALLWLLSVWWLLVSGIQGKSCPLRSDQNRCLQSCCTLWVISLPAECHPARCRVSGFPPISQVMVYGTWGSPGPK